jgi:hypothetical protein
MWKSKFLSDKKHYQIKNIKKSYPLIKKLKDIFKLAYEKKYNQD